MSVLRGPLIHTQPSMTSTKQSGSRLISGSGDLTWEGTSKSNSWRQVKREGQRKMKWAESSGSVRHSLQVGSLGAVPHPSSKPRGISLQAVTANQLSNLEVASGGGLSIEQSGGPVVGGFNEGEVAVANHVRV